MTREEVANIAQGRIWTGSRAVNNGLVDKLGSLEDAIACASRMSELDEYRIIEYPKFKSPIVEITEQLEGKGDDGRKILNNQINKVIPGWNQMEKMLSSKNGQGTVNYYLPYRLNWN